jgi:hypothetical protein
MPRTNLSHDEHLLLVRESGGELHNITEAVLAASVSKADMGNVGVALKIAAIRAHYRVAS